MDARRLQQQFFSSANEEMLTNMVLNDFKQRTGNSLTEKQETRLERTVTHYMDEVWEANGPIPLQNLNREVIGATISDFTTYLRRNSEGQSMSSAVQNVVNMPQRPAYQDMDNGSVPMLTMETGERFELLQKERNTGQQKPPKVPDFRINLDDYNQPSPLEQFEAAKKAREVEATRVGMSSDSQPAMQMPNMTANQPFNSLAPPNFDPNGNATITLAGTIDPKRLLPQDTLIKEESVVSYREIEENLIVYSADRDWLNNTTQSRYDFTVNFDVGNNRQGFGLGTATAKKFKNIVRIELVKAILPCEGLEVVMNNPNLGAGPTITTSNNIHINALSFPFITLRIPELDTNNYGSDNFLDNAFGVLQYDANWNSDNTNLTDSRGWLAMIPKHLKCQKVYQPTPLSTLTKLTFQFLRPSGARLSDISDSFRVNRIFASSYAPSSPAFNNGTFTYYSAALTDTLAANGNPLYWIVQTAEAFNRFTFSKGDRIVLKGLDLSAVLTAGANARAVDDLKTWLEDPDGHVLADVGALITPSSSPPGVIINGYNADGYANLLILQAPVNNPAAALTGVTGGSSYPSPVRPFGGTTLINDDLGNKIKNLTFSSGRILNLNHQTQVILRIITRELDPTSRVRPDNM